LLGANPIIPIKGLYAAWLVGETTAVKAYYYIVTVAFVYALLFEVLVQFLPVSLIVSLYQKPTDPIDPSLYRSGSSC